MDKDRGGKERRTREAGVIDVAAVDVPDGLPFAVGPQWGERRTSIKYTSFLISLLIDERELGAQVRQLQSVTHRDPSSTGAQNPPLHPVLGLGASLQSPWIPAR